ncbi:magnesium transporter [Anaerocolumna sp. MB42-C2]|uniref:magnesium transporter n=1 Tax=Anaerocolumna sp. MB42-C2 TaxID=3070997 RepID=UPI0027E1ED52|nr:magnesium transporter [Anaerocolumna sp. MB42-C2]WMJ87810.1 magnesium transporter [Anaerocolumna sp. MB42-C2]
MELQELLLQVFRDKDYEKIEKLFNENYAIDIASELNEFSEDDFLSVITILKDNELALIIEESSEEQQQRILELLDTRRIINVFALMSTDDIADILGIISIYKRKELLALMKASDSNAIQVILKYGEDTAGGIMTTQYIALRETLTVKDALSKIKLIGPKTEVIETIFAVDIHNGLSGSIDLRDILISDDSMLLKDIMNTNVLSVHPETDQEEVSLLVSKYDLKALPVVNSKNAILGIITVDDVIDVIVKEQTEDLLMISGVSKDEKAGSKLSVSIQRRLPWLFINLATAFLASFTVGLFEDVIAQVVALAAAMPIVAGMGGNAGTQTLSIVIRGIALGEINVKDDWRIVFKELSLGFINGLATGILTGLILYFRYGNAYLGFIILAAMIGNLMIAGFFGFIIPLILKRLKLDPAIASSIFLTTATDVCGFFIFLGLAKLFLPHLI